MKTKKKVMVWYVVVIALVLSMVPVSMQANIIEVRLNDQPIAVTNIVPYEDQGVLMIPLRVIMNEIGLYVSWQSATRTVRIQDGYDVYHVANGRRTVHTEDGYFSLSRPVTIKRGITYVSIDFLDRIDGVEYAYENGQLHLSMPSYRNQFSHVFDIEYVQKGLKMVTDTNGRQILIADGKTRIPLMYLFDRDLTIITAPVERVVLFSTTYGAVLDMIDQHDSVIGSTTPWSDWYIREFRTGHQQGDMKFIGDNWAVDFEALRALNPDLVILYDDHWDMPNVMQKLDEFGIRYLVCTDWLEDDPYARLEIGSLIAAFYDREMSMAMYTNRVAANVANIATRVADLERPKVVWGNLEPFGGSGIYVPNAGSYIAKWIDLAGGDYVFSDIGTDRGGSTLLDPEEFYARGKDADVFIYSGFISTWMPELSIEWMLDGQEILEDFQSVQNRNIWHYAPSWFQMVPYTDQIIEDLAAVFYPERHIGYPVRNVVRMDEE